jgi:hypothetical protein
MKHFGILVLTLFMSFQLWGQESAVLDKITLKTGEVYVGEIVVRTAEIVMLKVKNGTRYQFPLTEVRQIEKMLVTDLSNTQTANIMTTAPAEGNFSGQLEVAGGISNAKFAFAASPNAQISLAFGNKKAFGKDLFLGVGVAYSNTFIESSSTSLGLIPVFVRIQSPLSKKQTAPYFGLDAGYSFSTNPDFAGGTLIKVSIGIIHRLNHKTALIAGVYACLNSISGSLTETKNLVMYTYTGNTVMQNFGVKLGLQF